jgi:hypothetical protein
MNDAKLIGLSFLSNSGGTTLLGIGANRTGVTQSVTIPVTHKLVGFKATQTSSGDIVSLSTIEYTCSSSTPQQIVTYQQLMNATHGPPNVPSITNTSSTQSTATTTNSTSPVKVNQTAVNTPQV